MSNNTSKNGINEINEEDVMLKKKKRNFGKVLRTTILIIVLVLIADFAILLMLNKIGQVNINKHIKDVPVLNFFTNTQDTVDEEDVLISTLEEEVEDLKNQLKISQAEAITANNDNSALKKELATVNEKLSKIEEEQEEQYKLADYYSKMKPKPAAEALNQVKPELAIQIFLKMKDDAVAAIMQNMLPEKVAAISKKYSELKN